MWVSDFILLGDHWVSWMYKFTSFIKFASFWPLFRQISFLPLSVFPFGNSMMCMLVFLIVSCRFFRFCFSSFSFLSVQTEYFQLTYLQVCWIFLPAVVCHWILLEWIFNFSCYTFLSWNSCLVRFNFCLVLFLSLYQYSLLVHTYNYLCFFYLIEYI